MNAPETLPLRLLLVDDDPAAMAETRGLLAFLPEAQLLEAGSLAAARRLLQRHPVDLAIVDLGLPDGSGLELIREIVADAPREGRNPAVCIVQTVYDDEDRLVAALAAGAIGYLVKGDSPALLQERIRSALAGEPLLSPAIARRVLHTFVGSAAPVSIEPAPAAFGGLSPRELTVLEQVARGTTVAEVARALSVSENTVKTHLKSIYAKLGAHTRVRALVVARAHGLLRD
jgi:DNA-binding NarL/FixJ family response regulator